MNRLYLAAACLSSLLAFGCGPKEFGSVCTEVPAPAQCMTACDPTPGAPAACPGGFHCSPGGLCDAQCTVGGGQCGEGYACTADGYCIDDGGTGEIPIDASCPAVNFTPMPTTPSIALVLDRSGSMNGTDIAPNRFDAMETALIGTTGVVTQLETKAYFGSQLYFCNGTATNFTTIPRALTNAAAIRASLQAAVPGGGTPTAPALVEARTQFMANPPPAGSPPVIVVATDGQPNACQGNLGQAFYDQESENAAGAAFTAGFPVYVLALGDSATVNNPHFQRLANRGQGSTTNVTYYPVTNAAALQAAFQAIINGVISCDLSLTSSIDAAQAMNGTLTVNGVTLMYGTDWVLVGGNVIRVQGAACNSLKASANPTVQATFPCGAVIF